MRDPHDRMTAEVDGLEPPPPPPEPVPTQAVRRLSQGYCGPKRAPACRTCQRCTLRVINPDQLNERTAARCTVGDFDVELGGWCPGYTA